MLQQERRKLADEAEREQFLLWVQQRLQAALPRGGPDASVQDKHAALVSAFTGATAVDFKSEQRTRVRDEPEPAGCVGMTRAPRR